MALIDPQQENLQEAKSGAAPRNGRPIPKLGQDSSKNSGREGRESMWGQIDRPLPSPDGAYL